MRPKKVKDQVLLEGLMSVLREKGYDGSSLNELAGSSGLQKASLYHRFPNGKQEITLAVLVYTSEWVKKNIYDLLLTESIPQEDRLSQVIKNIDSLYGGGEKVCILRALSIGPEFKLFGKEIEKSMKYWIEGFTALGLSFGFNEEMAKSKALQALISVQGSLVVSKGLSSMEIFQSTLNSIKRMYIEF